MDLLATATQLPRPRALTAIALLARVGPDDAGSDGLDPAYTRLLGERPDTSNARRCPRASPTSYNILRDVGRRPQPRSYLPSSGGSVAIQYSEADLMAAHESNDNWRALMAFPVCCVPRQWFSRSEAGCRLAGCRARWRVLGLAAPVSGILPVIERHDYDVLHRRAFVQRIQVA